MKKSHLIVLSMAAVFALSACERRQRPPKPKATVTSEDKKTENTEDAGPGTAPTPGASSTPEQTTADDASTTEETPASAANKEEYEARKATLFTEQADALRKLDLGIEISIATTTTAAGESQVVTALIPATPEEFRELDEAMAVIRTKTGDTEEKVAKGIHDQMVATFAAAKELASYRKDMQSMVAVQEVSALEVEAAVKGAEFILMKLTALDAYLHDSKLVKGEPELK